jgi:hypothetical protein
MTASPSLLGCVGGLVVGTLDQLKDAFSSRAYQLRPADC